jgi:hypothetical protein
MGNVIPLVPVLTGGRARSMLQGFGHPGARQGTTVC